MSERCDVVLDRIGGSNNPHTFRYLMARGFIRLGETVVDGGCGTGYGSNILSRVAGKVYAMDYVDVFRERFKRDNIDFSKIDLNKFISDGDGCEVWISFEVIEHLIDPQEFLDKVTKCTNRMIIMSSPNKPTKDETPFHLHDILKEDFDKLMNKYPDWIPYHGCLQGYHWISIYVNKNYGENVLG